MPGQDGVNGVPDFRLPHSIRTFSPLPFTPLLMEGAGDAEEENCKSRSSHSTQPHPCTNDYTFYSWFTNFTLATFQCLRTPWRQTRSYINQERVVTLYHTGYAAHRWEGEIYRYTYLTGARTSRFITVFTRVRHRSLSWANWIHSTLPPSQSPYDPFWSHPPTYALVFQVVSFLLAFPPKPPHSPWFHLPNNIRGWVQNMKLLIV
jgi:hypothetical protein